MGEPIPYYRWRRKQRFQPAPYFNEPSKLELEPEAKKVTIVPNHARINFDQIVAVRDDVPKTARYYRAYHLEAEFDLISIMNLDRELGQDRPHREVLNPSLQLLRKIGTYAGQFEHVLQRLADIFERGAFDGESHLLYYEMMAVISLDNKNNNITITDLRAQIQKLNGINHDLTSQIESLQERLAHANIQIRGRDTQIRQQTESIAKLKALLQSASQSVENLHIELNRAADTRVMNSVLQRELDQLKVQYAHQRKENVESLELLNQTMEAKVALQKQIEEQSIARPRRMSIMQLPRSRSSIPRRPSFHGNHRHAPLSLPPEPDTRSLTPRPDWQKIARRAHLEVSQMSTVQAVDVLVQTLATRNMKIRLLEREEMLAADAAETQRRTRQSYVEDATEYIEGLGTAESIPRYLRVSGKVRRRVLTKRQAELTVRDVWLMKRSFDKQRGIRSKLADYVYTYLSTKYGAASVLQEWGYSLIEALKAYEYDADIRLFDMVLRGEVSEDVHDDQSRVVQHLLEVCATRDSSRSGYIDRRTFVKILLKMFPGKPKPNMRLLVKSLEREKQNCNQGQVAYERLFEENRDGDQGPFAECLRDQYLSEIIAYYGEIKAVLDNAAEQSNDGKITGQQIRDGIRSVEKRIAKKELDQIIEDVFGMTANKAAKRTADVFGVMNVIKSKGVHKRYTRPPEHEEDMIINCHEDDGANGHHTTDLLHEEDDDEHEDDDRELHNEGDEHNDDSETC